MSETRAPKKNELLIGKFRVAAGLCFKARLSAKQHAMKWFFIHGNKNHYHKNDVALGLVSPKWGFLEIWNGLLLRCVVLVNVFSHFLDKRLLCFIHSLNFSLGASQAQWNPITTKPFGQRESKSKLLRIAECSFPHVILIIKKETFMLTSPSRCCCCWFSFFHVFCQPPVSSLLVNVIQIYPLCDIFFLVLWICEQRPIAQVSRFKCNVHSSEKLDKVARPKISR